MPTIDSTTAVAFAAGSVVIALVLCVALRRQRNGDAAIGWLMLSNLALLMASTGVLSNGAMPFLVSSAIVIGGAYAGICFAFFAVLRAEAMPLPWRLFGTVGLVGFAAQAIIAAQTGSVLFLMATSSILNTSVTAFIIVNLWRLTRGYGGRTATLVCLPFVAICAGYAARLPVIVIWPDTDLPLAATALIVVAMAWASVILELALIALRETQSRVELKKALEVAEAASTARTRLLLGASHDLRTPLNAILGLSELMRHQTLGPLPDQYSKHAEQIHQSGTELAEMISDLLIHASEGSDKCEAATPLAVDEVVRQKFGEAAA
ncbi:MAG: sensor histidine kinase [Paracoccaceae bacterium]